MSDIYAVKEKLHKMRAKLYPSYLHGTEGSYIARTINEAVVFITDICASMKNRGGYEGSYEDALQTIKHFLMEMMYLLCDGFSVNTGFFTIHPNIGGTFKDDKEVHDHKKHQLSFRFQALKAMRDLRKEIDVIIEGYADTQGYIAEFYDVEEDSTNTLFTPGDQFVLTGHKLKVAGDDPGVGVFIVPVDNHSMAVKVKHLAENTAGKIIGIAPDPEHARNRIEVRTQFSGGSSNLKTMRVITSNFILEEA